MKKSDYQGLNVTQTFFYEHLRELLAPLNGWRAKIDFEELKQLVAVKLGNIDDEKFRNLEEPRAYIFKITKRTAIDLYRQNVSHTGNGRQVPFDTYELAWVPSKPSTNPEETMMAKSHVEQVLSGCNEEEQLLLGYIYEELSFEEIAKKMGITEEAVRQRKSRLFKKLRSKNPP